jgi:pectin methylesterase-like acyl-CoA thioesterase
VRQHLPVLAFAVAAFTANAQDSRTVTEPAMPAECATVKAAQASARSDDASRIQKAIDACPARRAVRLAADGAHHAFVSGPLVLRPGTILRVDAGVTLYASDDPRAFDLGDGKCGTLDARGHGCRPFLAVKGGEGGGIVGEGTIDGRGGEAMRGHEETWWQLARRAQRERSRQNVPRLVEIEGARDFTMYRIHLRNSPNFHVVLRGVDGFTAWGIAIDSPSDSRNTDGIDPMHSRNISIVASSIRTGDDGVAIKAGRDGMSENISVLDSHFYNGHGVSIGSETVGGVRHVLVEHITLQGGTSGLRIKSDVSRGGLVRGVRYSDVCLRAVAKPIEITDRYDPEARGNDVPEYRDIVFEGIHEDTAQCQSRFVPFPGDPRTPRPQLSDEQAAEYAYAKVLGDWDPLAEAGRPHPVDDYVVDARGTTRYATVQSAVDAAIASAAATGSTRRIFIRVQPGVYRERLVVPQSTAPITLAGGGSRPEDVRIVESPHGGIDSAVVRVRNDGFEARDLTFANSYNKDRGDAVGPDTVQTQAVAMAVDGADRVQFENVRFEGFQDTLYLGRPSPGRPARSFIHGSYIEGDMDFVFGEGTAYFRDTEIRTLGDRRVSYTLAPSTHYTSPFGFVFDHCAFTSDGSANARAGTFKLARQWFRGQRCTPYAAAAGAPAYDCAFGTTDTPASPHGTISRRPLEAVGKVAILDSTIGAHIDKARPWADWNAPGTRQHRPVQFNSGQWWDNLSAAGIDPSRDLGYGARKSPVEPFLVEYRNH